MNAKLKPKAKAGRKATANGEAAAATRSVVEMLVGRGVDLVRELRAAGDAKGLKATPAAMLRDAMHIARIDERRVRELRRKLESDDPALEASRQSLRRMQVLVRSPNVPFLPPTLELRRLRYLLTEQAVAELAALQATPFELLCVAVQVAGEKHPEDFGDCDDPQAQLRRIERLTRDRDHLYGRIAQEYKPADLLVGEPDGKGMAKVSFALSGGEVPLWPLHNAGERLVTWAVSNKWKPGEDA